MRELIEACRVVTYVPESHLEGFIEAIQDDIPAFIGNYERVLWWSAPGIEQNREKDSPETKRNPSVQVEFSMPKDDRQLRHLIENVIRPNHPWQEPVILIYDHKIASHAKID